MRRRNYLIFAFLGTCILLIVLVTIRQTRVITLRFELQPQEAPDWFYFPLLDRDSQLVVPMSYAPVVDGFGYHTKEVTPHEPEHVRVPWRFKQSLTADRYGFVFRLWPFEQAIDNSSAYVLWLNQNEMEEVIRNGTVALPRVDTLPRIPAQDLKQLSSRSLRRSRCA